MGKSGMRRVTRQSTAREATKLELSHYRSRLQR